MLLNILSGLTILSAIFFLKCAETQPPPHDSSRYPLPGSGQPLPPLPPPPYQNQPGARYPNQDQQHGHYDQNQRQGPQRYPPQQPHGSYNPNQRQQGPQYDQYGRPVGPYGYDPHRQGGSYMPNHGFHDRGDTRCNGTIHPSEPARLSVTTLYGVINGKYVYLCDGPGVAERDRPNNPYRDKYYHEDTQYQKPLKNYFSRVAVFLGIPYAKPPIGHLRFRNPEAPLQFFNLDTMEYRDACPQSVNYYGIGKGIPYINEDCLYLNVFSPVVEEQVPELLPVLMYIHGGFWDHGSGNTFPGHALAASQKVVVVTFNYRLGPLGFLATADNASAGNFGMLDQGLALEWVYKNIHAFNGDKEKITLFGSDAGAASAGLLALSPRTRHMVRRVIAQSGSAVADWAAIGDPTFMVNTSKIFGEVQGCLTDHSWQMVECLRSRTFQNLATQAIKPKVGWLPWGPVLDEMTNRELSFLPELPENILDRINFPRNFSYMTGVTRDEGAQMILEDLELRATHYEISDETFRKKIQDYIMMYNYTLNPEAVFNAISFMYRSSHDLHNKTLARMEYRDMLSDSYFNAPVDKMVKLLLKRRVPTYMYMLNYTIEGIRTEDWKGVPHDAEYMYLTGAPFMDPIFYPPDYNFKNYKWTEADRNMSQFFMEAWGNFARYGTPTPKRLLNSILWSPMSVNDLQYLTINNTNYTSVMLKDYRQKESRFWNEYLPSIVEKIFPTWPPTYQPFEQELRIYQGALWGTIGAATLFLMLTFLCCCLYCRAKSKHLVEDDQIPEATSTPATSELSLGENMKKVPLLEHKPIRRNDFKSKYQPDVIQNNDALNKHTQV